MAEAFNQNLQLTRISEPIDLPGHDGKKIRFFTYNLLGNGAIT
jgi:hypothetical protein